MTKNIHRTSRQFCNWNFSHYMSFTYRESPLELQQRWPRILGWFMTKIVHRTCRQFAAEIFHIIWALPMGEAPWNCNRDDQDIWVDSWHKDFPQDLQTILQLEFFILHELCLWGKPPEVAMRMTKIFGLIHDKDCPQELQAICSWNFSYYMSFAYGESPLELQ